MERIFETIRKYNMIGAGTRVIAGVSGGADSVCLLAALCRYREQVDFEITVVHVEHGIRGEESLADAGFVKALCERLGVPFRMERVRAEEAAARRRMTVEEAGRALRYEAFERIRRELGADRIAVAHNMGDQAETVLWNLVRGSGVKGLGGIRPVRDRVIRPLLFLERAEIEGILGREGIDWCTDRTNLMPDYTRNRIRLNILPALERELNSGAVRHISEAAGRMRELQEYLDEETDRAAEECIRMEEITGEESVLLSLPEFCARPPLIQKELLKRCLTLCRGGEGWKNFGAVHLEALLELSRKDCGKEYHLPGRIRAVREGRELRFHVQKTAMVPGREIFFSVPAVFRLDNRVVRAELLENSQELLREVRAFAAAEEGRNKKNIREKKYTKWLSYDTIYSNVCFRTRRPGDYLVVNEQGGRKKLKDYLIDEKVPKDQRDHIWLLAADSHILWVVGRRISEAVKIRQDTRHILKIQMEEEQQ